MLASSSSSLHSDLKGGFYWTHTASVHRWNSRCCLSQRSCPHVCTGEDLPLSGRNLHLWHCVSLVIPVHRGEGHIFHNHPELPGEGESEDDVVLFLIGHFWVWALWGWFVTEAWIWSLRLVTLLLQSLPWIHIWIRGGITGVPCWGLPISWWGQWGCTCLMGTLASHGASQSQEHSLPQQWMLRAEGPQTRVRVPNKYSLEILESGSQARQVIKWSASLKDNSIYCWRWKWGSGRG